MATSLNQRTLIIGGLAILLIAAFAVIVVSSSQSGTTATNTPTPQPTENANSIRTQVVQEMTETAGASSIELTVTALANALATVTKVAEAKAIDTPVPPTPVPPTSVVLVVTPTSQPQVVIQSTPVVIVVTATTVNPPQPPANSQPQSDIVCSDGRHIPIPPGGQAFPATVSGAPNTDYTVVYDPTQSGSSSLPAMGWWYQPCLPSQRVAHEVAIILRPGTYKFVGPECAAWLNTDGTKPFDQGTPLVSYQNVETLTVPATSGKNESWVFVRCRGGASSGFSFALRSL